MLTFRALCDNPIDTARARGRGEKECEGRSLAVDPGNIPLKQTQGWGPTSTPLGITVIPRGGVLQTSVMTRGGPLPPPTLGITVWY